jgi:hypothetical protein
MLTLYKASECKLERPKEDKDNKEEEDKSLQPKQALAAIDKDDESVE